MPSQVGGFIPPGARRKFLLRSQQRQRDKMRDIVYLILVILMFLTFVFYNLNQRKRLKLMAQVHAKRPRLRGKNASWVAPDAQPFVSLNQTEHLPSPFRHFLISTFATQNQDARATKARHLIVVAGHSVVISGNLEEAGTDENVWYVLVAPRNEKIIIVETHVTNLLTVE
jgi:hypothetical protein